MMLSVKGFLVLHFKIQYYYDKTFSEALQMLGLNFRNVDLHVHTPASKCFIDHPCNPEDIIDSAIDNNMNAIAITDHFSAKWIDRVKRLSQERNLVVFPGVELVSLEGAHCLAIFSETSRARRADKYVVLLLWI